jgi:hypothetical protein
MVNSSRDSRGTAWEPKTALLGGTRTIRPGIYWGGIAISDGANITMQPGVYIMAGGGFSAKGSRCVVTGTDVVIYNTQDPYNTGGEGAFDKCVIEKAVVTLQAPTLAANPAYAGFLFFNDRANSTVVHLENRTAGMRTGIQAGETPLKGFVYAAGSRVEIQDGGGSAGLGIVARTMRVDNGGTLGLADKDRIPRAPTVRLVD